MQNNTALTLTQMQYSAVECNEMKCSLKTNQSAIQWNAVQRNGMENGMEWNAMQLVLFLVKLTVFSLKPIITIITA